MNTHMLIVGASFLISLISAAVLFSTLIKNEYLHECHLTAMLSISGSALAGIIPVSLIFWYPFDFVSDLGLSRFLLSLSGIVFIIAASFRNSTGLMALALLAASAVGVLMSDVQTGLLPQYPLLDKTTSVVLLWSFAFGWQALSGLNPLPQIEGITISLGLIILYLFGQAPFILGASAASVFGALLIAYLYSKPQPLGIAASPVLGFLIGWLGLLCCNEYLLPCFVTFSLFYLCELLLGLARKITPHPKYRTLAYNTASVEAFSTGFPPAAIIRIIWNTNITLLIFGLFQINAGNVYSLPVFAALITIWQIYRLLNWQSASQTLKETNQEVIREIKKSVGSFLSPNQQDQDDDKTDKQ